MPRPDRWPPCDGAIQHSLDPDRHSAASSTAVSTRLQVRADSGAYAIEIGSGLSRRLAELIDSLDAPKRRFVVSNPTVWRLHGEALASLTSEEPILLPDGERFKNLPTVGRIYDALIRAAADRATTIVAIGGGVVGDIAGFAAATFLRGVPVVQVPTTLLAQVDSAIGGKVGVNHAAGKNLIGAYHQPAAVIIDPELLSTLPRREFRAGLYEVVKYGVIASRPLFERLAERHAGALRARAAGARAGHRRVLPHQGDRGRTGRAGIRAAAGAELRPHPRPCARSGDEVPAVPPRRGRRPRDARGGEPLGRPRGDERGRPRRAGYAHRADGTAAVGVGPVCPRRPSKPSAATRKSSPDGCTSCCRCASARSRPSPM